MHTAIIGLDGANWDLLDPWIGNGTLPNLAELKSSGVAADHHSCLPPTTCPNWRCYSTGKNPGKLGVFWFERINPDEQTLTTPDSTSFKSKDIWHYYNEAGMSCSVINLPMTYPPYEIDQLLVAGGPRSGEKNYTQPPELEAELEQALDYQVHPDNIITSNENVDTEIEQILDLIDTRFEAATYLADAYDIDILHLTIFYNNVLQHYFDREEPVRRAWERIDTQLGEVADRADNLIVLSDHGSQSVETVFHINSWLRQEGYLATTTTLSDYLVQTGITQERLAKLARLTRLEKPIRQLVSQDFINRFPDNEGIKRHQKLQKVDWTNTRAIASGQGPIYLTVSPDDPVHESIRGDIIDQLESLTDPQSGTPIATDVYRVEDYYSGPHVGDGPDIIFDQHSGIHTSGAMGQSEVFGPPGKWKAENVRTGLFLATGPKFTTGRLTETISIMDVAPTLLHAAGIAVPRDMDGEVLDVFATGSSPADRPVEYQEPLANDDGRRDVTDEDIARERLENIGYLQ